MAPIGNGLLYVRRESIPKFWPLQAAPEQQDNDIRKFEAIGTHPWAIRAGLGESLAFHQAIGAERKAARLRYLTLRWADALKIHARVKILTDLSEPAQAWGVAAVNVEGIDVRNLAKFLTDKYRIVVVPLVGGRARRTRFSITRPSGSRRTSTRRSRRSTRSLWPWKTPSRGICPKPSGRPRLPGRRHRVGDGEGL